MPLLRRARAAAIGTALLATGCLAFDPTAFADQVHAAAGCVQGGPILRYVVVFTQGTSDADEDAQVTAACGVTTAYYPQIAVGVATSADPSFGARIGPDRTYSAQAEAYYNAEGQPGKSHKSDELPGASGGITVNPASVGSRDLTGAQWDMAMIKADRAHRVTEGSPSVLVGVLDSGIDPQHPDLARALDPAASAGCVTGSPDGSQSAWAPTTSSHGTHVAGTIAAADDGHGIAGVAPGVRVASVKVVDDNGYIYPEAAVCGFMWAAQQGMRVVNNSYFVDPWVFTCENTPGQRVIREAVGRAVDYATAHGVLSVAAAGNAGVDLTTPGRDSRSPDNVPAGDQQRRQLGEDCVQLPAGLPGVVTVSAVGANEVKAGYSSYGLGAVDVTAPGGDPRQRAADGERCVTSTVPDGYAASCGTSMAAPHVAGVIALLASTHPHATPKQLAKLLDDQADPIDCPADYDLSGTGSQDAYCTGDGSYNGFYGHGLVDALAAVSSGDAAAAPPDEPPTATSTSTAPDTRTTSSTPDAGPAGLRPATGHPAGYPKTSPTATTSPASGQAANSAGGRSGSTKAPAILAPTGGEPLTGVGLFGIW